VEQLWDRNLDAERELQGFLDVSAVTLISSSRCTRDDRARAAQQAFKRMA
jgi:hypothetical protein